MFAMKKVKEKNKMNDYKMLFGNDGGRRNQQTKR